MALALGTYTFTTNAYAITQRALMMVGVQDTTFLGNGDTTITANAQLVALLNECERTVINDHPALAKATTDVSVTAGTRTAAVPAAVDPLLIDSVRFVLDGSGYDDTQIAFVTRQEGEDRTAYELNDSEQECPDFVYLDETADNFLFSHKFTSDAVARVVYQNPPKTFTTAMLAANDADDFSSVPDQYMNVLVYLLASRFAQVLGMTDKKAALLSDYSNADAQLGRAVTGPVAIQRSRLAHPAGRPPSGRTSITRGSMPSIR